MHRERENELKIFARTARSGTATNAFLLAASPLHAHSPGYMKWGIIGLYLISLLLNIACISDCNPGADHPAGKGILHRAALRCPVGARQVEEHPSSGGSFAGGTVCCVKNGVRDGPFVNYYRSGARMGVGTYKNGRLHGRHTNYYENGCFMSTGEFLDGKATGESRSWYPNGNISEERKPSAGTSLVTITVWHENGRKQRQLTIRDSTPCGIILNWSPAGQPEPTDSYFEIFGCEAMPDGALCPPCPENSQPGG